MMQSFKTIYSVVMKLNRFFFALYFFANDLKHHLPSTPRPSPIFFSFYRFSDKKIQPPHPLPPAPPPIFFQNWILYPQPTPSPSPPPLPPPKAFLFSELDSLSICQKVHLPANLPPPSQFFPDMDSLSKIFTNPPTPHNILFSRLDSLPKFQNSLTREIKIRVVGFVFKKLLTYFEMLIVPHFTLGTFQFHTASELIFL